MSPQNAMDQTINLQDSSLGVQGKEGSLKNHENTNKNQQHPRNEASLIEKLEHPNIVPIHRVCIDENGNLQVIIKKVSGSTLKEYIDGESDHQTRIQMGIKVLIQVCQALELTHTHHIIHRNIKCANIIIGDFHEIYLVDWGLAVDLERAKDFTDRLVGTPSHLAPEMLPNAQTKLDERTDIYLLGATLHYILLQKSRHCGDAIDDVLQQARASSPFQYPDFIPQYLAEIANKACAKNPEQRFQSVRELKKSLEASLPIWDSLALCKKANDKIDFLQTLSLDNQFSEADFHDISAKVTKAITMYEIARALSPNVPLAKQGIVQAKRFMLDFYFAQNKPLLALELSKQLAREEPNQEHSIPIKLTGQRANRREASSILSINSHQNTPAIRKNHLLYATIVGMIVGATFYAHFVTG